MRLFAIVCFGIAIFYGYTAVDAMRTGATTSISGGSNVERREVAGSRYERFLLARWVLAGGFVALGVVMQFFSGRFEKLLAQGQGPHGPRQ